MTIRVFVAALVLTLVAVSVIAAATAKPAAACSFGLPDDFVSALDEAADRAEIVIVGEVIDERTIEQSISREVYESTIRVVVAFKGSPAREITLAPLGFLGADCSGAGPRLPAGQRVLLFLNEHRGELSVQRYDLGKYVIARGDVNIRYFEPIPAEIAFALVAAITDAPDDQLNAALAYVGVGPQPEPTAEIDVLPEVAVQGDGPPALLIGLGAAGAAVALLALLFGVLRLRRAR